MDSRRSMAVVALMLATLVLGSAAQVCNMNEAGLTACRSSVSWLSQLHPSDACCEALSKADLTCFCSFKNYKLVPPLGINLDLAKQLPTKCNITPPKC